MAGEPGRRAPCSDAADLRGDQLFGTAPPSAGFLLIEQPGHWGRDAAIDSRLDREVAAAIVSAAAPTKLRVLLVKRPGRRVASDARRWFAVTRTPETTILRTGVFEDASRLPELLFDESAGAVSDERLYLVCTHGRHDACCARRGRPVAHALAQARPEATWECSHLGGDRFAPNVLVLPSGALYGRLVPGDAAALVRATESAEVLPGRLRGITAFSTPAQAAQHFARLATDERGVDRLRPTSQTEHPDGTVTVGLGGPETSVEVTVARQPGPLAAHLTCSSHLLVHPAVFRLVALEHRRP